MPLPACRLLQATATLIHTREDPAASPILRVVAHLPVQQLRPATMQASVCAWFWVMAAAPGLTVSAEVHSPLVCALAHMHITTYMQE